jgi:predicted acylesterase/phospholipase RssA
MTKIQSQVAGQAQDAALWNNEVSKKSTSKFMEGTGFEKLQGATLKSAKTPEALINSKELFKNFFHSEIRSLSDGMSAGQTQYFEQVAEAKLNSILDSTFAKMEDRLVSGNSIKNPKSTMREANKLATEFFKMLEPTAMAVKTDTLRESALAAKGEYVSKPQIFARPDGGYNVVTSPVSIENLVLKGGGGKGIGYPPALAEMSRAGQLDSLKQVVGTSAGALTAVAVAVNLSAEEMTELGELDMGELLGSKPLLDHLYPELEFSGQVEKLARIYSGMGGDAQGMVKKMDEITGTKAMEYLNGAAFGNPGEYEQEWQTFAEGFAADNGLEADDVYNRLQELRHQDFGGARERPTGEVVARTALKMAKVVLPPLAVLPISVPAMGETPPARTDSMITFMDMKMLHALAPSEFREIQLTGYDKDDAQGVYMNADATPDMPIAYAARISMAHPAIASAIHLDVDYGIGTHTFADGGIATNSPVEAVYSNQNMDAATAPVEGGSDAAIEAGQLRSRTALMIFDEGGKGYTAMHGAPEDRTSTSSFVDRKFGVTTAAKQGDKDKEYVSNTFVVFHGKVGTMDTSPSQEKGDHAKALSTFKMLEQINNRCHQPNLQQTNTLEQAYGLLSDSEKQLLLADGPPKREDFVFDEDGISVDFIATGQLYDMARAELT